MTSKRCVYSQPRLALVGCVDNQAFRWIRLGLALKTNAGLVKSRAIVGIELAAELDAKAPVESHRTLSTRFDRPCSQEHMERAKPSPPCPSPAGARRSAASALGGDLAAAMIE